jgi:hypothetical protein
MAKHSEKNDYNLNSEEGIAISSSHATSRPVARSASSPVTECAVPKSRRAAKPMPSAQASPSAALVRRLFPGKLGGREHGCPSLLPLYHDITVVDVGDGYHGGGFIP